MNATMLKRVPIDQKRYKQCHQCYIFQSHQKGWICLYIEPLITQEGHCQCYLKTNKKHTHKLRLQAKENRADTDKNKGFLTNSDLYDCELEIRVRRPNNGGNKEAY